MPGPADWPAGAPDHSGASDLVGCRAYVTGDGRAVCELLVGPQHRNRAGLLHGGLVSMLLDNGCGVAVRQALGDPHARTLTVTLSVNFIAGATEGLIVATGRVTGGGRGLKFAAAELRDEQGNLLATASAVFKVLRQG